MNRLVFLFFFFLAAPCSAGIFTLSETIDFTGQSGAVSSPGASKSFSGWKFTLDKPFTMPSTPGSLSFGGASNRVEANNSNVAVLGGTGYKPAMVLERTAGTAFSLGKIDFGGNIIDATSDWAEKIRITDITTGGSGNSVDFTLNSNTNFYQQMSVKTAFANVKKVSFQGISSGTLANFTVDNIQIGAVYDPPGPAAGAVPEPTSLVGMAVLCVGSIFISQRKRNASVVATAK
ncbi:MAG: PEP-CTERM sorting domain-containing protein [Rubripirellula sp.]